MLIWHFSLILQKWGMADPHIAHPHIAQPKTVEAIAILRGLQLCNNQGFDPHMIESDNLLVVEEITQQQPSHCIYGNIIQDIRELMSYFCN